MAVGFRQRLAALSVPKAQRRKELLRSRSDTFPSRMIHPVVAGLDDSINALHGWTPEPAQPACTAWIRAGMDHLGNLLSALTDMLRHPLVQDPERRRCNTASSWTERLLSDLIILADAHSCFCEVLASLKRILDEAQAAVRHRDAACLAAALRMRHRSDRALSRLASTLRDLSHHRSSSSAAATSEAALAEVVAAATCAAAVASAAIFAGLASASASSALRALTSPTAASPAKAIEQLQSLQECVVAAEDGCEQVHRALVNARMSLLNVLSPC